MNHWSLIEQFAGGILFSAISVYIFAVAGYENAAKKCANLGIRTAEWNRRHPWVTLINGICIALFGSVVAVHGIAQLLQQNRHGTADLIVGLFAVIIALYPTVRYKQAAEMSASYAERYSEFIRQRPWILLLIGILTGVIGVLFLVGVVSNVLKH